MEKLQWLTSQVLTTSCCLDVPHSSCLQRKKKNETVEATALREQWRIVTVGVHIQLGNNFNILSTFLKEHTTVCV